MQDPRARLRAFAGDGFHLPGPHARRYFGRARLARHRIRGGRSMRAPAMGLSLLALVSAGTSVDVQCSGTGCGAELIADGWTKIAECGGHSWSYLLAKGSDVVVCTGIAAYGGPIESP